MADHHVATIDETHDARLRSWLDTVNDARMRERHGEPALLARSNFRHAYWTIGQIGLARIGFGECRRQVLAARR